MFCQGFLGLGDKIDVAATLGNGQAATQQPHLFLADIVSRAFGHDASGAGIVEIVQILCRVMAHLVDVELLHGFDGLRLQTYIIIIGGSDNGHFRLGIAQPLALMVAQHAAFLVDALLSLDSLLTILVEGPVITAALTKAHVLNVADQQLQLIVGGGTDLLKETVCLAIVHASHRHESQMVQGFGTLRCIGRRCSV